MSETEIHRFLRERLNDERPGEGSPFIVTTRDGYEVRAYGVYAYGEDWAELETDMGMEKVTGIVSCEFEDEEG